VVAGNTALTVAVPFPLSEDAVAAPEWVKFTAVAVVPVVSGNLIRMVLPFIWVMIYAPEWVKDTYSNARV
jgi:hypothetical protein